MVIPFFIPHTTMYSLFSGVVVAMIFLYWKATISNYYSSTLLTRYMNIKECLMVKQTYENRVELKDFGTLSYNRWCILRR